MSRKRKRIWLVETINLADQRDDEVWRVRADSAVDAESKASCMCGSRWAIGRVVPARGGTRYQRALAKDFRTYATRVYL